MPYVPIAPVFRPKLTDSAEKRWQAIGESRPDLLPALGLQRQLLTRIVELAAVLDGGRLPKLSLPPRYLAAKLARGVPALAAEPIPLPVQMLVRPLLTLCSELSAGGAAEAADHIRSAIESGNIEAGSLLAASLSRDQHAIRQGAVHRGLAPDLVWLVAELAVSPFAHALQRTLFSGAADSVIAGAREAWDRGYCPACGSWPALAEVVGGHRLLRCSFCAAAWELNTYACVYCGESGEAFALDIGDENPAAVWIPGHHAHGFEALTDLLFCYHVTKEFDPEDPDEQGLCWADPRVRHLWSTQSPILSERDLAACS